MSVEWDEGLVEVVIGNHTMSPSGNCAGCGGLVGGVPWPCLKLEMAQMARAEHTARLEAEAERDALAEKVESLAPVVTAVLAWVRDEAVGHEEGAAGYRQAVWDVRRVILNADAAILSDQEGRPRVAAIVYPDLTPEVMERARADTNASGVAQMVWVEDRKSEEGQEGRG